MILYEKKYNYFLKPEKNPLQLRGVFYIIIRVVTLIAMKREVAAKVQGMECMDCRFSVERMSS